MDTHISTLNEYTESRSDEHDQAERHEETGQSAPAGHARRVAIPGEGEQVGPVPLTAEAPTIDPSHARVADGGRQSKDSKTLVIGGLALAGVTAIGFYFATTHHRHPLAGVPSINSPAHVASSAAQAIHPQGKLSAAVVAVKPQKAQVQTQADMSSLMALQNSPPADATTTSAPHPAPPAPVAIKPPLPAVAVVTDPVPVIPATGAKPISQQQQADVLQMLTKLAAVVRDLRLENGIRQQQIDLLSRTTHDKLDDFESRLLFAEAHNAVNGAADTNASLPADAKSVPISTRSVAQPGAAPLAQANMMRVPVQAVTPIALRNLNEYRLQAASPGLAVLQVSATGLSEPGILQVAAGDKVPGLGHILSITEHGAAWEVRTDRGVIR